MRALQLYYHCPDSATSDTPTPDPHIGSLLHFVEMKQSQSTNNRCVSIHSSNTSDIQQLTPWQEAHEHTHLVCLESCESPLAVQKTGG